MREYEGDILVFPEGYHDETNTKETTQKFTNKYNKHSCDFLLIQKSVAIFAVGC